MPKDIPLGMKVSKEEKDMIEAALKKANKENMFTLNQTSLLIWLVKRYLAEKK